MVDNKTKLIQVKNIICASNVQYGCHFQNLEPKKKV